MNILIGDIGSTTAQWALLTSDGETTFSTDGFNPYQHDPGQLEPMLREVRTKCPEKVDRIYYYGSGVMSSGFEIKLQKVCQEMLSVIQVYCYSDILAVARSASADTPGIVAILGTGSNSCLFDGKEIIRQIPSLGFVLGDEGSGADIGRACVRAFYYGQLTPDIAEDFRSVLPEDRVEFLEKFRAHPAPNRFLASLVPVAARWQDVPQMYALLRACFLTFVRSHIAPYGREYPVHLSGGVADTFRELLRGVLLEEELTPGSFLKSPLPGLISFHKKYQI